MTAVAFVALIVGPPALAFAQGAIVGAVRDTSGTPIQGVTVEAASAALIEKARTTLTDDQGGYRIENLRPGTYTVRFTFNGWRPYEYAGVDVTSSFTATIDAELSIGPVSETVTVTRELPIVDVTSASQKVTVSSELARSIPTARTYNGLLMLVPGPNVNGNDIVTSTSTTSFPVHGGRTSEGRLTVDGLTVGSPPSGNSATSYVVDVGTSEEVTFMQPGARGETETGGVVMNLVPQTGGNSRTWSLFVSGTGARLQSDNVTPQLAAQGVTAATPLTRTYDVSGAFGGPVVKDRVWYFVTAHTASSRRDVPNVYYNLNAGDPSKWLYRPDLSRHEYSDRTFENASARVTWQVTGRNKVGLFWDAQALCRNCTGATAGLQEPLRISPEAVGILGRPLHVAQATWSSPLTNQVLVEASAGGTHLGLGNFEREPNPTRDLIRVVEQCASGCSANGNIPGLVYRSQDFSNAYAGSYLLQASLAHVTVRHSLKIGYQHTLMTDDRTWYTNNQSLTYRFDNGVPNQLTQSISPWVNDARVAWQAVYAQEQWTLRRLTMQGALRFDRAWSWFPAQQEGPSRFLPTPILIPETRGVDSYKDISPRIGAAYDLSSNHTTVFRVSLGRYLEGAGASGAYANSNPTLRLPQTTAVFGTAGVTRAWTDANGNLVADCDLLNPAAQDLRGAGGDACGVLSNTNFGRNVVSNNFDAAVLSGWGSRPSDWTFNLALDRQLLPRTSLNVAYIRRWFSGFTVVDNLLLQSSDLTPFRIVAPVDPRLPEGGGYVVDGLFDVNPDKAGQVNNLVADSRSYGKWSQYFNGIDVTVTSRTARGLSLVAGTSTGQTVADNCAVRSRMPELSTSTTGTSAFGPGLSNSAVTPISPYCHVAFGILTQFKGLSSYRVPKMNIDVGVAFQSKPGAMLAANYVVRSADVAPSLGRPLSGSAPNITVNLVEPGTMYGTRINQLDFRLAKMFRYRGSRAVVGVDIYNAMNSSVVLAYNYAFVPGGTWLQPLTIMTPRFLRLTAEIDF